MAYELHQRPVLGTNYIEHRILVNGAVVPEVFTAPHARWLTMGPRVLLVEPGYRGSVPAFRQAVDQALLAEEAFDVIACLHDDVEILEPGWDTKVRRAFERNPALGLAGFGGATGLGALDMYDKPYDPMSLARTGFRSNLEDAEVHGARSLLAERCATLDGFSLIGRRTFWEGYDRAGHMTERPWTELDDLGLRHHAYDLGVSALATRNGWEVWYCPVRCKHWGGRTAVGDQGYQAWAKTQHPEGDQGLWAEGHRTLYDYLRGVLPIRV